MTGCVTKTEFVYPDCEPAPRPALPYIDAGELYNAAGPELYDKLTLLRTKLVTWALENEAVLEEVCKVSE